MKNVTIYTTPTCGYCRLAKELFRTNGVQYEEKDVAVDEEARHEMIHKTHQMGVPVIEVDNEIMVGFDQQRLSQLLGI